MQLLGQPITHTTFGKGIVTDWNDHSITVCLTQAKRGSFIRMPFQIS